MSTAVPKVLWPKILQSSVTGIIDHEELRSNNTAMWNSAIQFLIDWYLNAHHTYKLKLNPFLLNLKKSHNTDDSRQINEDESTARAESLKAMYSHEKIHEMQSEICTERAMSHIVMISYGYHSIANLFTDRKINLIPQHQAIIWAGLSNTGKYHEFPIDKAGVTYIEPDLPADILPEMHETARQYHKNVAGACAATLYAHKMRDDAKVEDLAEAEAIFAETCALANKIIIDLLKMELESQMKMAQLRAMLMSSNHHNMSWMASFDNTWRARPNIFSSPLSGVHPGVNHAFEPYNGPLDFSDRVLREQQWNVLLGHKQIPIYYDQQARACQRLSTYANSPFNMQPTHKPFR